MKLIETKAFEQEIFAAAHNRELKTLIHPALVVIDMINDGCSKGGVFEKLGFDISGFKNIIPSIIKLAHFFKGEGWPIYYVTSFYNKELLPTTMSEFIENLIPADLELAAMGSWGSQIIAELPNLNDYTVIKSHYSCFVPGYSAVLSKDNYNKYFAAGNINLGLLRSSYKTALELPTATRIVNQGNASILGTLDHVFKKQGIDSVFLTGGSTHVCLASAVYSAFERGFRIVLPVDAIASEDRVKHWIYLHNFMMFNCDVITVERFCRGQNSCGRR